MSHSFSQKFLRSLFLPLLLLLLLACTDQAPEKPEDLGRGYWQAIERDDFASIYPFWVDIKDLNVLMEIVPSIKKYYQKGSLYSEKSLISAEKRVFKDIIINLKKEGIEINNWEKQEFGYQRWIKEKGIEVG
ncbi:MAG: hypothetical protein AAFU64_19270, partial [Bacteroidota bacterium]